MNNLQKFIGQKQNYFVTLNPSTAPDPNKVLQKISYHHPQYTLDALNGWQDIGTIQGKNKTWFCGAWCGFGFHEDGITAGLSVAEQISDIKRPWTVTDKSPSGFYCRSKEATNSK
jgi:predicted NAD/FAD-binding protein